MLRQLIFVLLSAILLAGCNPNNSAPTQAVQNTNATPVPEATAGEPLPTTGPREYSTEEVVLSMPGTIIAPATEDPSAGEPFAVISLNRSGGFNGKPLEVILTSDGTITRDGVTSAAPPEVISQLNAMLTDMSFFGMQGIFEAAGTADDIYTYNIRLELADGSARTVTAEDGYIPPELAALIEALQQLGSTT